MPDTILEIDHLVHAYKTRRAVDDVSLRVYEGEVFAVLGPNGSGKTTLFRILSTLFLPASGMVRFLGMDLHKHYGKIRAKIGVVFQNPALDLKLTVRENLLHQGHLYGIRGAALRERIDVMLERLGLSARRNDPAGTLSGGLKRRVDLAKGMLHGPRVLLLDEPSTGLDPGARAELWNYLMELRNSEKVSILVTTHFMDEAGRADRLMILSEGRVAALGSPEELLRSVGSDFADVLSADPSALAQAVRNRFPAWKTALTPQGIRIDHPGHAAFATELLEAFPQVPVTFRKATLEDVFLAKTGHAFWETSK